MLCLTRCRAYLMLPARGPFAVGEASSAKSRRFRRGGTHENLAPVHHGRPDPLRRDRVRRAQFRDQEPGWDDGLPPGGYRGARRVVIGGRGHPGPEVLPEVRGTTA